jgi:hypothetical protein
MKDLGFCCSAVDFFGMCARQWGSPDDVSGMCRPALTVKQPSLRTILDDLCYVRTFVTVTFLACLQGKTGQSGKLEQ